MSALNDLERKFKWCLEKGKTKRGRKHRGLRRIEPNQQEAERHIRKALHNLEAVEHNAKGGFSDWAVAAAFYAMYHSLLAVLCRLGYESRNQECTISAIEYLIETGGLKLDAKYVALVRRTDDLMGSDAKAVREEFQYGTKVEVDGEILSVLRDNSKELVESVRVLLEEMK